MEELKEILEEVKLELQTKVLYEQKYKMYNVGQLNMVEEILSVIEEIEKRNKEE